MATVQVVYALTDEQAVVEVPFESGMTAARAVELSGLLSRYAEIDPRGLVLGVFGERVAAERLLQAGDRVEICRPLRADPRDLRRLLQASGKVMGGSKSGAAE